MGIDWLIEKIKSYLGTTIIISHDRYFLDQVTQEIAELDNGEIVLYNGNYTDYRNLKQRNYDIELHQYEEQQKREKKIDQEIERLQKWSNLAHRDSTKKEGLKEYYRVKAKKKDIQVKSAIKRLERMREVGVKRPSTENAILFEFASNKVGGKKFLTADSLSKSFTDKILFTHSDFYIKRGEHVGLIGVNGCGKTTLIKMILGLDKDYKGEIAVDKDKIAYLSQDVLDLDDEVSINELICDYDKITQTKARTLLAASGITSRMIYQKINSLSLGERTRVKLIFLILAENSALILDEPTNHLDLHSREQLEKTLLEYDGTLLIASHDRYLLEKITNKILVFENHNIKRIEFGYKEYLSKKQDKTKEYDLMLIENQITYILGELNKYKETDEMYQKLDQQFKELINKKKELLKIDINSF